MTINSLWPALLAIGLGPTFACGAGDQLLGGRVDAGGRDSTGSGSGGTVIDAGGTGGTGGAGGTGGSDAAADSPPAEAAPDGPADQLCGAAGSALAIPTARGDVCAGDIANQAFRYALCTCTQLAWTGALTTDSFDSTTGQKGVNAAVGVDGDVIASQPYHIGGSFWIAGGTGGGPAGTPTLSIVTTAACEIGKELHVGGDIAGQGTQTVGGDLFSKGNITCLRMSVGGAIHVPTGAFVVGATAVKGTIREPVTVAKPCDCAAPAVDTARVVDSFSLGNDDAAHGIAATDLTAFVGPKTLDLSCGRFHFQQISGRDLTLRVTGRVAISVAGDLTVSGPFNIDLGPGAELDLFVRGNIKLADATWFGNKAEPAKIRVYVAGASVVLPAGMTIGANIYAPASLLSSGGALEMWGALFANRLSFSGAVTMHYDQAVLGGRGCPTASGGACATCKDCNGGAPACRQGACTTCATSADCCSPLVCTAGSCLPLDVLMSVAP